MNLEQLRQRLAALVAEARQINDNPGGENRSLTSEQEARYAEIMDEGGLVDQTKAEIARLERLLGEERSLNQSAGRQTRMAPNINRIGLGDSEIRAAAHYVRTGDTGGFGRESVVSEQGGAAIELVLPSIAQLREQRAVDSTMNITTDADGGVTVPVGLAPRIAQRMNERALYNRLGCQNIPGVGITVNHVYENADPVVFATTAEQADDGSTNNYERDAMVLAEKPFTLVKKTKKLHLTEELLLDNDVNLMEAIANWISRNMASTLNSMLITEVAANGSPLKTYAAAAAIAAGEPEDIVFNDTLGYYLDDASNAAWVTRPTTFGNIASITGDARLYAQTPGGSFARELLGYPVHYSNHVTATAASAKDLFFGDWSYVGYRLAPELRLLQDPYSVDGVVVLKYMFRAVFGVLIAGAVGYGQHPTA